jgi:hypothetical protein
VRAASAHSGATGWPVSQASASAEAMEPIIIGAAAMR